MLHLETIEPRTLDLLRRVQALPELQSCRLVGGTALALQIGHRKSVDLDLFGQVSATPLELEASMSTLGNLEVRKNSGSMHLFVLDDIHIDIVDYPFPWRQDMVSESGLRLTGVEDIAAMKINAIIGRGTKKDFVDVSTLLNHFTLEQMLSFYESKYPNSSIFMALKSLSYFDDAEMQPMPYMFTELTWEQVKHSVIAAIDSYAMP